mmetsp:Transcript_8273/g.26443  ORF Transcript_8273/g.26443 Transcript_8273/m.26443 type:complete len:155 (-) Transcript_8273:785-1249(-)
MGRILSLVVFGTGLAFFSSRRSLNGFLFEFSKKLGETRRHIEQTKEYVSRALDEHDANGSSTSHGGTDADRQSVQRLRVLLGRELSELRAVQRDLQGDSSSYAMLLSEREKEKRRGAESTLTDQHSRGDTAAQPVDPTATTSTAADATPRSRKE